MQHTYTILCMHHNTIRIATLDVIKASSCFEVIQLSHITTGDNINLVHSPTFPIDQVDTNSNTMGSCHQLRLSEATWSLLGLFQGLWYTLGGLPL